MIHRIRNPSGTFEQLCSREALEVEGLPRFRQPWSEDETDRVGLAWWSLQHAYRKYVGSAQCIIES